MLIKIMEGLREFSLSRYALPEAEPVAVPLEAEARAGLFSRQFIRGAHR